MQSTSTLRAQASNLMATAKKKKISNIGQVAYLTKQVASLEKDLVRKDIEKLDQKVDGVKTELNTKIDNLDSKVESNFRWLKWILGSIVVLCTGGFTALLSIMLYLHSDTKQDMKELKQDINSRFDKMEKRFDKIEKRFDNIEKVIENINQKLK